MLYQAKVYIIASLGYLIKDAIQLDICICILPHEFEKKVVKLEVSLDNVGVSA